MSGHSKWANIRVKKTAQDAKRGKVFTRHARLIEMAAREGGSGDPAMNPGLRTAIDNAKADSVPNANIERAVKKGTGDLKGEQIAEVVLAAYGPANVAFIIECLTDNRNRTLGSLRSIVERRGYRWSESAAVLWMFDRKGVVAARRAGLKENDALELKLIDAGAEDIEWSQDAVSVTTDVSNWSQVRDALKAEGCEIVTAGLKFVPKQTVAVTDLKTAEDVFALSDAIEEDDDVSEVHTNADIAEEIAAQL